MELQRMLLVQCHPLIGHTYNEEEILPDRQWTFVGEVLQAFVAGWWRDHPDATNIPKNFLLPLPFVLGKFTLGIPPKQPVLTAATLHVAATEAAKGKPQRKSRPGTLEAFMDERQNGGSATKNRERSRSPRGSHGAW